MEIGNAEFLVWGMQVVIRQSKAHHDGGNFQTALKVADDWNGPAGANEDCVLLKDFVQSSRRSFHVWIVHADHDRIAGVNQSNIERDSLGTEGFHVFFI
jgi:hypothetical protein